MSKDFFKNTEQAEGDLEHELTMPHIYCGEKGPRQLDARSATFQTVKSACYRRLPSTIKCSGLLLVCGLTSCGRGQPPGAHESHQPLTLAVSSADMFDQVESEQSLVASSGLAGTVERGSLDDNIPFEPNGTKLASIAWRTWIYTDVGPARTRLGYLRAGAIVDARGPEIKNSGCEGGWWRINPRGFVCVGKGATLDLDNQVVRALQRRAKRGRGFPYQYARSKERSPDRYFRLPTVSQMIEIEGRDVVVRGPNFQVWAEQNGFIESLDIKLEAPEFLRGGARLEKPYGVKKHLQRQVHSGRASSESGFALLGTFLHEGRAFGLSSELDLLALDRLDLVKEPDVFSVLLEENMGLPVAFHVKGANQLWRRTESGHFVPEQQLVTRRGFALTGERAPGNMIETTTGLWLNASTVRVIGPRDSFPSVATGRRKWIDVSIRDQALVAYEGRQPVFATLISAGRGGIGKQGESNPDGERTVRGTFMIYEKSVSSTMDGDEDRADSYELQDVPFVQYFHRGFALHGAYWHNEFGKERSHGCINLAPADAAWLFEWTDPEVPQDWHAVLNKQRGTVVHVRY